MSDFPRDQLSITQHSVTIGGQSISYTAVTGTLILKEEAEKQEGKRESEGEKPKAPSIFCGLWA